MAAVMPGSEAITAAGVSVSLALGPSFPVVAHRGITETDNPFLAILARLH